MKISPLAGKPAPLGILVDVPKLVTAYYTGIPDPSVPEQRVAFGTSGHRGSSFNVAFNEWHILAITQAICLYRKRQNISGPLYLGIDTHALSIPACATALEVLAANGVEVMLAKGDEYTPTPVISHAILTYNRGRKKELADGIVITPSHNPPHDGGFKYNPPSGGPADNAVTGWIEAKANALLEARLKGVKRIPHGQALRASTTHRHDYALLWFLVNDRIKLLAYRIFDPVKANAQTETKAVPQPDAKVETKPDPKTEAKPEEKVAPAPEASSEAKPKTETKLDVNSTPDTKAKTATDLTPQISARAYELYEHQGHRDGQSAQNWDKAEQEIRETQVKAEPKIETKTAAKDESQPEVKAELKPDNNRTVRLPFIPDIRDIRS
jgi:hypothetical protein